MPDLPADILSGMNVLFGFGVFVVSIYDATKAPRHLRWLKIMQACLGLYWGLLYLSVLSGVAAQFDPVYFGRLFVRPAFTVTLGLMFSAVLFRARAGIK